MHHALTRLSLSILLAVLLAGCVLYGKKPVSSNHLPDPPAPKEGQIPQVVTQLPILPDPGDTNLENRERYTVVVHDVPVRELLFALARDTKLNVDIHPAVDGRITMNAVDQTLPTILERLATQIEMRYRIDGTSVVILPDSPFWRTYKVDYPNLKRSVSSTMSAELQVGDVGGGAGGGGASSTTTITNEMNNSFWEPLVEGIRQIIEADNNAVKQQQAKAQAAAAQAKADEKAKETLASAEAEAKETGKAASASASVKTEITTTSGESDPVIEHQASGVISVLATTRQHVQVQGFLDTILSSSQRQVLIEATVVEVTLSDAMATGVDWSRIAGGTSISSNTVASNLASNPVFFITETFTRGDMTITGTIKALSQLTDVKVLSSPKIMALNNQPAILKVFEQKVYFEMAETQAVLDGNGNVVTPAKTTATVKTVPIGLILNVTPQVGDDETITLTIRPSLSRYLTQTDDPTNAANKIPVIQVREMESLLRVSDGQTIILGGLIDDNVTHTNNKVPLLSAVPVVGDLFKYRSDTITKTELAIFLRPTLISADRVPKSVTVFNGILPRARNASPPVSQGPIPNFFRESGLVPPPGTP
ncbi:MAG: Type II secretory pathway component PulD [Magnetococcales bacterium]|nr:Type II secretory pathway component PulD [Magnetococcales bacterium]